MQEKKAFRSSLGKLALPIIVQNLLSSAVGTADTLMISAIGQNPMAAVSLANQLFFVLSLFFTGLTGSAAIMLSQYMGKGDEARVRRIFTMTCLVSEGVSAIFALIAVFAPGFVMGLLTNEAALITEGSKYLRIVGASYLFIGISRIYMTLLKARKESARSMRIGVMTLLVNLFLNAVFIYGLFGAPKLGVIGVALATCIAHGIELVVCVADMFVRKPIRFDKKLEPKLFGDFVRICAPLTIQGFVWGGAMACISAIMGHLGSDIVAAHAVAAVWQNMATVATFAMAEAGSILLGRSLGAGRFDRAKREGDWIVRYTLIVGLIGGAVMLLCRGIVVNMVSLTDSARSYLNIMYTILSVNAVFAAITYNMLCGVFPAGGDTRYGLILDGTVMWSLVILGSIGAFVLKLPPIWVFVILSVDELTKTPLVLIRYKQGKWINNVTRSEEE